jgi:hypothetical protein
MITAFVDGGSTEPEAMIAVEECDFDASLTSFRLTTERITLDLLLDQAQLSDLIAALRQRQQAPRES